MAEEFIRSTRHHLTFLVLVVLVLLYQVFYVQRNQLKALSSHHKEAFSRLQCDGTGVEASNTNVRYVPDSSEYTRYKKQNALNNNYNDSSYGGYNNSAYTTYMKIGRFA